MVVVQKYGGTSVADVERMRSVAGRIARTRAAGHGVVVVVSAMEGETNGLLALGRAAARRPDERESDALVATGEQVTAALLALALQDGGRPARSFLGHQVRIETDSAFGRARIVRVDVDRLRRALAEGTVAVVAGFQGVDGEGSITTLGRGGSDTSAVALAAALGADACEIYTDVEGVYTSDPRIVPQARKLERIAYDEMLELASLGAKVLQIRSVEFAKRYRVPVHVRSSFGEAEGTWVVEEDPAMEEVSVAGVAYDRDEAKLTVLRVPDRPGLAARVFGPIARANIVVDMIIQNASADGTTDLTFTVSRGDFDKAKGLLEATAREIGAQGVAGQLDVAKVSIVGIGMRTHAGIASRMFDVLSREGINIQMISTSEIKISVVIDAKYTELAVRALHDAFIGSPPTPNPPTPAPSASVSPPRPRWSPSSARPGTSTCARTCASRSRRTWRSSTTPSPTCASGPTRSSSTPSTSSTAWRPTATTRWRACAPRPTRARPSSVCATRAAAPCRPRSGPAWTRPGPRSRPRSASTATTTASWRSRTRSRASRTAACRCRARSTASASAAGTRTWCR